MICDAHSKPRSLIMLHAEKDNSRALGLLISALGRTARSASITPSPMERHNPSLSLSMVAKETGRLACCTFLTYSDSSVKASCFCLVQTAVVTVPLAMIMHRSAQSFRNGSCSVENSTVESPGAWIAGGIIARCI